VLVSSRNFPPFFFTPLERGRNWITVFPVPVVPSDCFHPVVGTHPRCVLIEGYGPIQWDFLLLIYSGPRIRTHLGCVPTTGSEYWIGRSMNEGFPMVPN
jgi:hypothetical protein